jgi:hypothetical protein
MMRALRIMDSPYRLSVSFATFRIICCPFLVFGAGPSCRFFGRHNDRAIRLHQCFKFKVVACWPEGERWWITAEQIAAVVKVIEQEAAPTATEKDSAAGAAPSRASLSTGGRDAA